MKAASSEWYDTTARHVLPYPSTSSSRTSNRFHGSTSSYTSPYATSSFNSTSGTNNDPHSFGAQRSTSTHSNNTTSNSSFKRKPYSFSKSRSSQSNSTTTAGVTSSTDPTTSTGRHISSLSSRSDAHSNYSTYQGSSSSITPLYPLGISGSFLTSSFQRISETEQETDLAFTEEEEDVPALQPTDEAPTTEEDEEDDDDQVYASFKDSLRMLRVQHQATLRSLSPALSIQSVLTDLEEDEEDLSPDRVEDCVLTTEGEDEEEEESVLSTPSKAASYNSTKSVPKTPVKVRVKVEKASSSDNDDDRVKVTVQLDETEVSGSGEEEEESIPDEDTATTSAETVRFGRRVWQESCRSRTEDDETDDYGDEDDSYGRGSDSELLSEVPEESWKTGKQYDKTDSRILTSSLGHPYSSVTSLPDIVTSRIRSGVIGSAGRGNILREIKQKTQSESNKSDSTNTVSGTNVTENTPPPNNSSNSDNSSRSQSARISALGRASHTHRMYAVGGKLRSLSARRSVLPPTPLTSATSHPLPPPSVFPLSGESSSKTNVTSSIKQSTSSSLSDPAKNLLDTSSSTHYMLTKFASLAPTKRPSSPITLPPLRSLSATRSSQRQLHQLRQLSLGNITSLPPITPSSPSQSSTTSSLTKPRPLLRNETYTVLNNTYHLEDLPDPHSAPQYVNPCVAEHLAMHELELIQGMSRPSTPPRSGPVLLPYDTYMTAALSFSRREPSSCVSFASYVMEHSLSSIQDPTASQSTFSQRSVSGTGSNEDDENEEAEEEDNKEERLERERAEREDRLFNKTILTFGELGEVSGDEDEQKYLKKDKLKRFALAKIRKQMEIERKRLKTIEINSDGESDEDDVDEDEGETEDSDEDTESNDSAKKKSEKTHIPMPVPQSLAATAAGSPAGVRTPESAVGLPLSERMKSRDESTGDKSSGKQSQDEIIVNQTESDWNWKDDLKKDFEDDDGKDKTPVPSRPHSSESGYRALPPSRACSREDTPPPTLDFLEREKERLLKEWKNAAPSPAANAPKSALPSESGYSPYGDGTDTFTLQDLIQGDIDLNRELPKEEKKLVLVWEEFNRDERAVGAMADYEFSTLLDEMIQDVNSYKPKHSGSSGTSTSNSAPSNTLQVSNQGTSSGVYEPPKFDESRKYQSLPEMVSLLSHNLRIVSPETLEDHMASLISLTSGILRKVRKNKLEDDYITQISCLSAIRVLCDRLQEMHNSQNLKYADLSWLFRILCKYSSDSSSKIRPEASFCLARLVTVAGPALVVRPIYFILVMESDSGQGKTTTGAKTKAAAIDTLTYALLTFPKEDFHNLEEIAGWICLAMLNEERRIRQSCLECLAVISQHMGGREKAIPLFHTLFLKEELDHFSRSPSPESNKTGKTGKTGKPGKGGKGSDPIPISVHGTVRLLTGPGFPIAQPIDAITARLEKDILPVPSTKGLIEYAVNVPTGKDLVLLMTHMLDKDDDEWDFSSSTDSLDSGSAHSGQQQRRDSASSLGFSDIDWTGEGPNAEKKSDPNQLISPDVAYILLGKGRVNKQEVLLLDTYKKEILPEILEMLGNKSKRKNRKRYGKQKGRRRRRKGPRTGREQPFILDNDNGKPPIPSISFDNGDGEEGEFHHSSYEDEHGTGESFDNDNSPVAVVVDPPHEEDEESPSQATESATQSTSNS